MIGPLGGIEKEHEADQCPIDRRRSIAFGKQVVPIGFGIGRGDLGRFEARAFLLQPSGKAASVLGIERNGFSREIRAQVQLLLPSGNLIPHDSPLLSVQLYYRRSFWRYTATNAADNIPQRGGNCADNASFRSSPSRDPEILYGGD
jgi:hypothetical protein